MTDKHELTKWGKKYFFALYIFSISVVVICFLATLSFLADKNSAVKIFHIVLPVFASWVGTILAFYYGKEYSDSTNMHNIEFIEKFKTLSVDEIKKKSVKDIMRNINDTQYFRIPLGKNEEEIKLSDVVIKFSEIITRLPILNSDYSARYMIHINNINKFYRDRKENGDEITLLDFINSSKDQGIEYGINKGFVLVTDKMSLGEAKKIMETNSPCQDIFINESGNEDGPINGWISNVRLIKYLIN
jgi:hypothetical protein